MCYLYMHSGKDIIGKISEFYKSSQKSDIIKIEKLEQAGSERIYFRVYDIDKSTAIVVYNPNAKENETFIYYTKTFLKLKLNVPEIYAVSKDKLMYILQDLGDIDLLELLEKNRNGKTIPENILKLYKESISQLVKFQITGHKNIDYSKAFSIAEFNTDAILFDLNYFKYYFLNRSKIKYDEQKLHDDFIKFAGDIDKIENKYFMFRDFQARNIMIFNNQAYFIDYQGGRKGAMHYDIASLLYQAKAQIPTEIKDVLIDFYISEVQKLINIDKKIFKTQFYDFAFLRVLQTLGAYGNRGLIERKAYFIQSIPYAIKGLKYLVEKHNVADKYPELKAVCKKIIGSEKFTKVQDDIFTIRINSFSYKKNIPEDATNHGGGFVFDCRGIHNPGRYPEYQNKTGQDTEVIEFFRKNTKIDDFIKDVYKIVEYNIKDYLERDFKSLMINFGCTGGQHRSVYCAEEIAKKIKQNYPVKIILNHIERGICREM